MRNGRVLVQKDFKSWANRWGGKTPHTSPGWKRWRANWTPGRASSTLSVEQVTFLLECATCARKEVLSQPIWHWEGHPRLHPWHQGSVRKWELPAKCCWHWRWSAALRKLGWLFSAKRRLKDIQQETTTNWKGAAKEMETNSSQMENCCGWKRGNLQHGRFQVETDKLLPWVDVVVLG